MGEGLTKEQKISDGKRCGGGERKRKKKRLQLSRDERGQRVRAGGTQRGGRGRGEKGRVQGLFAPSRSKPHLHKRIRGRVSSCVSVALADVVLLSLLLLSQSDRRETFWETNSINSQSVLILISKLTWFIEMLE